MSTQVFAQSLTYAVSCQLSVVISLLTLLIGLCQEYDNTFEGEQ